MTDKTTSAKAAKLAGRVLEGYKPTRSEIKTLAGSVLAQRLPKTPRGSIKPRN